MDWPDQHGGKVPKPDVSLAREAQGHGTATFGESAVIRATKALLIFANPVAIDCQRRKWPLTFQTLFDTGRLAGLATNETDVHIFSSVQPPASTSSPHTVHLQKYTGVTFGERLEGAVETLAGLGYGKIVIVGTDCPSLTAEDIATAFQLLDHKRLVLGPDHRGGCYLIGLHREDRVQLAGIRWHKNTDFCELLRRYEKNTTAQLPVKIDLDTLEDLQLLAQSATPWSNAAAVLLQILLVINSIAERFQSPLRTVKLALSWQIPPPLLPIY